jgi:hypothetical protein
MKVYNQIILKKIIMPSEGKIQKSAGVKLPCPKRCEPFGTRVMKTNNSTITPTLRQIDNIEYKGNAVLNANK